MNEHDQSTQRPQQTGNFWTSRTGIVLVAFLAVAALLLIYEHRVHVFTGSGILIALLVLCVGMHVFMHGGHNRHGRHGGGDESNSGGNLS